MQNEVQSSMNKAEQWAAIAIPIVVQCLWPGAVIYRTEDQSHPACQLLDQACGIDYLIEHQGLVKGLSVRCQKHHDYEYCMRNWQSPTFTVRNQRIGQHYIYESELEKTIEAERRGAITAAYQLHAYVDVDDGPAHTVVAWGVAKRVLLFEWIKAHKDDPAICPCRAARDNGRDQTQTFFCPPFSHLPTDILVRVFPELPQATEDHCASSIDWAARKARARALLQQPRKPGQAWADVPYDYDDA